MTIGNSRDTSTLGDCNVIIRSDLAPNFYPVLSSLRRLIMPCWAGDEVACQSNTAQAMSRTTHMCSRIEPAVPGAKSACLQWYSWAGSNRRPVEGDAHLVLDEKRLLNNKHFFQYGDDGDVAFSADRWTCSSVVSVTVRTRMRPVTTSRLPIRSSSSTGGRTVVSSWILFEGIFTLLTHPS